MQYHYLKEARRKEGLLNKSLNNNCDNQIAIQENKSGAEKKKFLTRFLLVLNSCAPNYRWIFLNVKKMKPLNHNFLGSVYWRLFYYSPL